MTTDTKQTHVITYDVNEAMLADLREQSKDIVVTNPQDYKRLTEVIGKLTKVRTGIEARRVELKADALEYGRKVDAEAKRWSAIVAELEEPLRKTKKDYDDKIEAEKQRKIEEERKRVDGIHAKIAILRQGTMFEGIATAAMIAERIDNLTNMFPDMTIFMEHQQLAEEAKVVTLGKLGEMVVNARQREQDEADKKSEADRVAAEQKAEADRLRKEREELEAQKAADAAKAKADADALAAKQKEIDDQKAANDAEALRLKQEADAIAEAKATASALGATVGEVKVDGVTVHPTPAAEEPILRVCTTAQVETDPYAGMSDEEIEAFKNHTHSDDEESILVDTLSPDFQRGWDAGLKAAADFIKGIADKKEAFGFAGDATREMAEDILAMQVGV